jgi:hypothetical protein
MGSHSHGRWHFNHNEGVWVTPFTRESVDRALKRGGGLYDFEDILGEIEKGSMQSHYLGDNWVVTKVVRYPRKIVLEIILAVGNYDGIAAMEPMIRGFARENSCELIIAWAREGWERKMTPGWKKIAVHFMRSVE